MSSVTAGRLFFGSVISHHYLTTCLPATSVSPSFSVTPDKSIRTEPAADAYFPYPIRDDNPSKRKGKNPEMVYVLVN
jgi:hypothetical protein